MPGRVFLTTPAKKAAAELGAAAVADEPPRRNIAPGQEVLALAPQGMMRMRWGMIPVGRVNARGRPVMETIVNAGSGTAFDKSAFSGTGRAVVPVGGWWAWGITPRDGGLLYFAAITDVWRVPGKQQLHQPATVICTPSADVAPAHHRLAVILARGDIAVWLGGNDRAAARLMLPWPDGRLQVEPAEGVDWAAP